jgi:hypothetical protein
MMQKKEDKHHDLIMKLQHQGSATQIPVACCNLQANNQLG